MNINEIMAHAKRAVIISQAITLMADPTLEWHEDFSLDIRMWTMSYLTRNLDAFADDHLEAYYLAKILIKHG